VRLNELRTGRALPRRYRNRRIGEFLKELDMTEGRATGIPKILHAMKANGSPPPVFDFDADHTFFMCRLPVHPQVKMPEAIDMVLFLFPAAVLPFVIVFKWKGIQPANLG
jgi:ATP-dependent DNA helicase RecG